MFHKLGRYTASRPWTVCVVWLVAGLILALAAPKWDGCAQDDDIRFLPERFTSVRAYQLMQQAFPHEVYASRLIFALERENTALTETDFQLVAHMVDDLEKLRQDAPELKLGKIDSFQDGILGSRLTSSDGRCTLVQVALGTPFLAVATQNTVDQARAIINRRLTLAGSDVPRLYTTGAAGLGRDLINACGHSLETTTIATVLLVVTILLLVYRAPLLALVPLLTIAVSVWISLSLLAMATALPGVHLMNTSKIFAIVMLYGAGTDYCLFLISRYREELGKGYDTAMALSLSIGGVGQALTASAGTVMVGLGMMGFAEFAKVRCAGPAIGLSLGVALLAALTLTPALLRLLGPAVFWPCKPPQVQPLALAAENSQGGFWEWASHRVVNHPALVWGVSVALLLPLVVIGWRVPPNYRATGELSPTCDSLQGIAAIQRHFAAGQIGPITVLLHGDTDWTSRQGRMEIDHLSRGFASLPNVVEVRSLMRPLGTPLPDWRPAPDGQGLLHELLLLLEPHLQRFRQEIDAKTREFYVAQLPGERGGSHHVTRLDVVLKSDPFEPDSAATLRQVQTWLREEMPRTSFLPTPATAECFGITANAQDLAQVTESDRRRINMLVLAAIFLILLGLVRRFWLTCYLMVTVLFSYLAALGATVLAGFFWTGQPLTHVDWRLPFFLFILLVAVGEDYNIFLISRALQERKRHGAVEGMRRALARTGGAITSCGLIMAGTFATLMLSGLGTLIQVGFALAIGVLLDTFVVRPFFVPAFAVLFWRDQPQPQLQAEEQRPPARKLAA